MYVCLNKLIYKSKNENVGLNTVPNGSEKYKWKLAEAIAHNSKIILGYLFLKW